MLSLVDAAGRAVPFPTNLLAATPYLFSVRFGEFAPAHVEWSLRQGSTALVTGTGVIQFSAPEAALAIYVRALLSSGTWVEGVFNFSAVPRRSVGVEAGITWSRTFYDENATLRAVIDVLDPEGLDARSIHWQLFKNSALVMTGDLPEVCYPEAGYGVYHLHAMVQDGAGAYHTADATTYVMGGFEVQATVAPAPPSSTMYHLGDVFLNGMKVDGGISTELPVVTSSLSTSTFLLPGTTHIKFDLVGQADDDVVVRTALGNWSVIGPPTGFVSERVGYDYALPPLFIPVGPDLCLKVTVDVWNVRGYEYSSSAFSVRIRCFREGPLLNEYAPCQCANYTGGDGDRTRKMALIFSEADLELDVESDANRLGSSVVESFTTDAVTSFQAVLASAGQPYPVDPQTGFSLSPSNLVASYEPVRSDLAELDARGVAGIPGVRPFILTFSQASNPQIVQRLKRVGGRVACYISEGAVEAGAVVTVGIETSARGRVSFNIPVTQTVYAESGVFAKVGEVALELADYDFTPGGLVAHLSVQDKLVARRNQFTSGGQFTVVQGRVETSANGQFRITKGQPENTQSGRFLVTGGVAIGMTSGEFRIVAAQTAAALTGQFLLSARQQSADLAGSFKVVRGTQRRSLVQSGQFVVLQAVHTTDLSGSFCLIPDPTVYRNLAPAAAVISVSCPPVSLDSSVTWQALIPVMTSATTPYGTVDQNSFQVSAEGWRAFGTGPEWVSGYVGNGHDWVQYTFAGPPPVVRRATGWIAGTATAFSVLGSNDGVTWVTLASLSFGSGHSFDLRFNNSVAYATIRFAVTAATPAYPGPFYATEAAGLQVFSAV